MKLIGLNLFIIFQNQTKKQTFKKKNKRYHLVLVEGKGRLDN